MLYNDFTEKLLGLQDFQIEKIEEIENTIHIYGKMKRKEHTCPHCSAKTDKVHDYREQVIKDIPAFGKTIYLHLKKRRYRCSCGKRFQEKKYFSSSLSSLNQQAGGLCYQFIAYRGFFLSCCQRG